MIFDKFLLFLLLDMIKKISPFCFLKLPPGAQQTLQQVFKAGMGRHMWLHGSRFFECWFDFFFNGILSFSKQNVIHHHNIYSGNKGGPRDFRPYLRLEYGGLGRLSAELTQKCTLSLAFKRPKEYHILLESQYITLYQDPNYVHLGDILEVCINQEFKDCNFQYFFSNWNISVDSREKFIKFWRRIAKGYP